MSWIAVGLSTDLRHAMAMPACIDGVDLAIWRSATGKTHAWGDRCPHRGMRLSQGFVRGETLSCIYHGWQYGSDGGCAYIPAHPNLTPPKSICAKTYDCQDADGLIWVALKDTVESPPKLNARRPVRSIPMAAPVQEVAGFFGDTAARVVETVQATLVLQATKADQCNVHVLSKGDAKETSRWIEAQRREIEGVAA